MFRRWLAVAVVVMAACAKPGVTHDEALDFQDVKLGESRTVAFAITNPTSVDIQLVVSLSNLEVGFSSSPDLTVPAKGSATLDVTFAPNKRGPSESVLRLSNGRESSTVTLSGRAIGSTLNAPEVVSLGLIRLQRGEPSPTVAVPLRVSNVGTSQLEVTLRSVDAELCIGDDCSKWATTLGVGEALDAPITVTPLEPGEHSWTIHVQSNDFDAERRTIIVRATVQRFGPCELETPTTVAIRGGMPARVDLKNNAPTRCSISELSLTSTPDVMRIDGAPTTPIDFEPGQTRTLWLKTITPRPQQAFGTLRIVSVGAPAIEIPVTLDSSALDCLVISPNALDFGTVKTGCSSATRTFDVYNTCTSPLTVTTPQLSGAGFELVSTFPSGELAGSSTTPLQFSVRYAPTVYGPSTGAVTMTVDGFEYFTALQGRGDIGGPSVDTFSQGALPVVDLVVMVDTSPSFAHRRANTRTNLRQVLTRAGRCADLRAAVAPADGDADAGVSFALNDAGSAWTSNRDVDFFDRVLGAFDSLPTGSETEACVGPAAALMQTTTRRDGGVLGLCITDALEQTPNAAAAFQTFSGGRPASWAAVFASSASTCAVESVDDGVHQSLVQSSNGLLADVCNADWGSALYAGIGYFECGYRSIFYLTSVPASAAAIEVRVNDQVVTTGWSYDSMSNAVQFARNAEPAAGSTIVVTHTPACVP